MEVARSLEAIARRATSDQYGLHGGIHPFGSVAQERWEEPL